MELDFLIFPAPRTAYTPLTLGDELIYIPKFVDNKIKFKHNNIKQKL